MSKFCKDCEFCIKDRHELVDGYPPDICRVIPKQAQEWTCHYPHMEGYINPVDGSTGTFCWDLCVIERSPNNGEDQDRCGPEGLYFKPRETDGKTD